MPLTHSNSNAFKSPKINWNSNIFSKPYLQDKFATNLNHIWNLTQNIAVTNQPFVGQTTSDTSGQISILHSNGLQRSSKIQTQWGRQVETEHHLTEIYLNSDWSCTQWLFVVLMIQYCLLAPETKPKHHIMMTKYIQVKDLLYYIIFISFWKHFEHKCKLNPIHLIM